MRLFVTRPTFGGWAPKVALQGAWVSRDASRAVAHAVPWPCCTAHFRVNWRRYPPFAHGGTEPRKVPRILKVSRFRTAMSPCVPDRVSSSCRTFVYPGAHDACHTPTLMRGIHNHTCADPGQASGCGSGLMLSNIAWLGCHKGSQGWDNEVYMIVYRSLRQPYTFVIVRQVQAPKPEPVGAFP